jgi:hypothetical protein
MGNLLTNTLPCKTSSGATVNVTMKSFAPNCPKINVDNQCSALNSAYLAAITVCRQGLYV